MDYLEFKNKLQDAPIISSRDLVRLKKGAQALRNQLNRWQQRKLLIKLKKGMYLLNESDRKITPSRAFIANQLYWPSYVSLEYALGIYGLIPEKVVDVTSVSTKKTAFFKNELGNFLYQHIKPEAFRGIRESKDNSGLTSFIAEPEKAIVDWLYFNSRKISPASKDIFKESFRFQNVGQLKSRRIIELAKLFHHSKLLRLANNFCEFIRNGGTR